MFCSVELKLSLNYFTSLEWPLFDKEHFRAFPSRLFPVSCLILRADSSFYPKNPSPQRQHHRYVIRGAFNRFPDFFVQAFKIVVDSWKFSILLLYILWDDWHFFMISGLNEQLQEQLEYTLLKPNCHSWGICKMLSDTLEERYAIRFHFKLEKMPQKRM